MGTLANLSGADVRAHRQSIPFALNRQAGKRDIDHMPDENKPQSPLDGQPQVEFVIPDPDGIFTTYANNIQVGYTIFDVRFVFGEVVETHPEKIVVEQRAQVTISYLQAKLLNLMLAQLIAEQEARVGEIRIPTGTAEIRSATTAAKVPIGTFTRG